MNIEKGIPIPTPRGYTTKPSKYPFLQMAIGDSFVVHDLSTSEARHMHTYAARAGVKVVTRLIEGKTYRVWRTA